MNKIIMIVGAGFGQLPAIEKSKELGLTVIAIDKNINAIGMQKADIALEVDIIDIKKVVEVAKNYKIDGIMTMQSDIGVPSVGAVVDELNLNGVSLKVANRCSNKIEIREFLANHDVPQPNFKVIETYEEAVDAIKTIGLPCVIKAPDSSGSRGITKVSSINDVQSAFDEGLKYSRIGKLLVEEFIDGEEIGAQSFSVNGKCIKVLVHNDTISPKPYMIPTGHSFPSKLSSDHIKKVEYACKKAVDAIEINSGPANIDIIISKDGRPMIIEIGARIGATCLPELVKYYTGVDWVEQTIKNAIGSEVNLIDKFNQPVAAYILESNKDGVFQGFKEADDLEDVNIKEWEVTVTKGETVSKLRKGTDRIGKIITIGNSVDEAEEKAKYLKSKFEYMIDESK